MNSAFPTDRQEKRKALLEAAKDIREVIESSSEESERTATLAPSAVKALQDSGLLNMKLPKPLGGAEADPVTQMEVLEEVTYADSAAGWCLMIGSSSIALPAAFLGDSAIDRLIPDGYVPRASTAFMPSGSVEVTESGYKLNGRWSFASGVRHSEWVNVGGLLHDETGNAPPQHLMFTLPTSQARIHDNWDVIGLRGTGSCDLSLDGVFVPNEFAFDGLHGEPQRGGPLFRLGMPAFVANEHAAFAFGVARKALDIIIKASAGKMRGIPPTTLSERGSFQRFVGESEVKLSAAKAHAFQVNERAWNTVLGGSQPELALQIETRSAVAYATDVAVDTVTEAYRYAGGSAVYQSDSLQRCLRDINTAAQHLMVSDSSYELQGRLRLGQVEVNPLG